jgi:hypothetical protein
MGNLRPSIVKINVADIGRAFEGVGRGSPAFIVMIYCIPKLIQRNELALRRNNNSVI